MRILTLAWVETREESQAHAALVQALTGPGAEVALVLPDPTGPYVVTGLRVLCAEDGAPFPAGTDGPGQATRARIHAGSWPETSPRRDPGTRPLMAEMACVA